ncbi:MAG TPA: hypothetical protein VLS90_18175, partial [Thermodesulfobacteriota bacterium]|nr:hypothetical protein [Thermodesulfobacteriota bacterium]
VLAAVEDIAVAASVGAGGHGHAVVPGDRVEFVVQIASRDGDSWKLKGQARVGSDVAAEANLEMRVNFREVGFDI